MLYHQSFSLVPHAYAVRLRVKLLRDTGSALSAQNAFLILLGIETLPLRMREASRNVLALAERLQAHPKVAWVNYPGLPDNGAYALARRYLSHGRTNLP